MKLSSIEKLMLSALLLVLAVITIEKFQNEIFAVSKTVGIVCHDDQIDLCCSLAEKTDKGITWKEFCGEWKMNHKLVELHVEK